MNPVTRMISALALLFALGMSLPALASEDESQHEPENQPEHFEGLPAKTDKQARDNLEKYNAKLKALLNEDKLSASRLSEVHRISYTLENALARLAPDAELVAEYLEEVHLASERGDRETVRNKGRAYLSASGDLLEQ